MTCESAVVYFGSYGRPPSYPVGTRPLGFMNGATSKTQRWLWVTPRMPLPPRSGAEAYSGGLITALARSGVGLRVVCLGAPGGSSGADLGDLPIDLRPVASPRRSSFSGILSPTPRAAHNLATRAMRRELDRALAEGPYHVAVVDHLQSGWALPALLNAKRAGVVGPVCLITHNHETSARARTARAVGWGNPTRTALQMDAWKWEHFETRALRSVDLVTAITEVDRLRLVARRPDGQVLVLPPGYDGPRTKRPSPREKASRRAVILTSLDWRAKQANLEELLEAADDAYAKARAEIVVVGDAPASFRRRIESRMQATSFLGHVSDLGSALGSCRLALVSEPRVGGFEMKTLDLVFAGVPMAVLEGSASGLPLVPGKSCLSFSDIPSLVKGSLEAMDAPSVLLKVAEAAYDACRDSFDWPDSVLRLKRATAGAEA